MAPIATRQVIALESRLKGCRNVRTLGVRPNFSDYSLEEVRLIRMAGKVYYPSMFYAALFRIMGIETFPRSDTYVCAQDKIKQTALLEWFRIPHPRTRVFYGKRQKKTILEYFRFPFIAKIPRGSALGRGVFLINNQNDLDVYLLNSAPAYVQEYMPVNRDIRVVVIGQRAVHAYWRVAATNEFRCNIAMGAHISFDPVPDAAIDLACLAARRCRWDDAGIDICACNGSYYVLEANMKYGKEGFKQAGIDYLKLMEDMIDNGFI